MLYRFSFSPPVAYDASSTRPTFLRPVLSFTSALQALFPPRHRPDQNSASTARSLSETQTPLPPFPNPRPTSHDTDADADPNLAPTNQHRTGRPRATDVVVVQTGRSCLSGTFPSASVISISLWLWIPGPSSVHPKPRNQPRLCLCLGRNPAALSHPNPKLNGQTRRERTRLNIKIVVRVTVSASSHLFLSHFLSIHPPFLHSVRPVISLLFFTLRRHTLGGHLVLVLTNSANRSDI